MRQSIDKTVIEKTNAWPFVEAKKILKERKQYIEKKNKIILQETDLLHHQRKTSWFLVQVSSRHLQALFLHPVL